MFLVWNMNEEILELDPDMIDSFIEKYNDAKTAARKVEIEPSS